MSELTMLSKLIKAGFIVAFRFDNESDTPIMNLAGLGWDVDYFVSQGQGASALIAHAYEDFKEHL